MEGEFTKEQIDEFKEAFTVFDKGTSIYYVGISLEFFWPTHQEIFVLWYYCSFIWFHLLLVQISELFQVFFWLWNAKFKFPMFYIS